MGLVLSPDSRELRELGYSPRGEDGEEKIPAGRIALKTGKGLWIGDSIATVKTKLGPPMYERTMRGSGHTYLMRYVYDMPPTEKNDEGKPVFSRYEGDLQICEGQALGGRVLQELDQWSVIGAFPRPVGRETLICALLVRLFVFETIAESTRLPYNCISRIGRQ